MMMFVHVYPRTKGWGCSSNGIVTQSLETNFVNVITENIYEAIHRKNLKTNIIDEDSNSAVYKNNINTAQCCWQEQH